MLDALLPAQPADVADEGGTVGEGGGDGEGLEVEEVLVGDEDFVAVGFEVPIRNKAWRIQDDAVAQVIADFRKKCG